MSSAIRSVMKGAERDTCAQAHLVLLINCEGWTQDLTATRSILDAAEHSIIFRDAPWCQALAPVSYLALKFQHRRIVQRRPCELIQKAA